MSSSQHPETSSGTDTRPPNLFSSFSTYLTSTVGVTILLMPKLFGQAGMLVGTAEILLMGIAIYYSTSMLCKAAYLTNAGSYYETMLATLPRGVGLANFLYLLLLFGNILVYQTFALKNLVPLINTVFHLDFARGSAHYMQLGAAITVGCNLLILPFLFSRKLRFVKVLSNFCASAVLFSFLVILTLFLFPHWFDLQRPPFDWSKLSLVQWDGAFVCVGYYLLSFCFQQIAVEISREIRPKSTRSVDRVIFWNCLVSIVVYLIVSCVGYLLIYTDPDIKEMNNFITYLILQKHNRNSMLFIIDICVIFAVAFANILNYIPTIKYLKARFNKKPELLHRLNAASDSEIGFVDADEGTRNQIEQFRFRNRMIVWALFLSVLTVTGVIVVLDLKMDFVFNLVSAVGGPAVLIVMPSLFYRYAVARTESASGLSLSQNLKIMVVLFLGTAFWVVSILGVFYA